MKKKYEELLQSHSEWPDRYVYVYMYVRMYVCMYVCMYVYMISNRSKIPTISALDVIHYIIHMRPII